MVRIHAGEPRVRVDYEPINNAAGDYPAVDSNRTRYAPALHAQVESGEKSTKFGDRVRFIREHRAWVLKNAADALFNRRCLCS